MASKRKKGEHIEQNVKKKESIEEDDEMYRTWGGGGKRKYIKIKEHSTDEIKRKETQDHVPHCPTAGAVTGLRARLKISE